MARMRSEQGGDRDQEDLLLRRVRKPERGIEESSFFPEMTTERDRENYHRKAEENKDDPVMGSYYATAAEFMPTDIAGAVGSTAGIGGKIGRTGMKRISERYGEDAARLTDDFYRTIPDKVPVPEKMKRVERFLRDKKDTELHYGKKDRMGRQSIEEVEDLTTPTLSDARSAAGLETRSLRRSGPPEPVDAVRGSLEDIEMRARKARMRGGR